MCGSLLARVVPGGVELKCRRCKRLLLVPWEGEAAWTAVLDPGAGEGADGAPVRVLSSID
jgi:hypothetical protein